MFLVQIIEKKIKNKSGFDSELHPVLFRKRSTSIELRSCASYNEGYVTNYASF